MSAYVTLSKTSFHQSLPIDIINKSNMKTKFTSCLFVAFMLSFPNVYSKVITCSDGSNQVCIEINRVSFDGGDTWSRACAGHVVKNLFRDKGIDDCFEEISDRESSETEFILDSIGRLVGIEHKYIDPDTDKTIINKVEFSGRLIKLNDKVITILDKGITTIEIKLPGYDKYVILNSGELTSLEKINELALTMAFSVEPFEVEIFPKIVLRDLVTFEVNKKVKSFTIFDTSGNKVLMDNSIWEGQRTIDLLNLPYGFYMVLFEAETGEHHVDGFVISSRD